MKPLAPPPPPEPTTSEKLLVEIRDAIKAKEKNAVAVTVRLLAKPGKVFYVLGEVNAPGAFPITGHDTALSAITQAGGPTRRASAQNIILSRPTVPEGCRVVYPVCYTNIVQLGDTSTNYQILPGDRIALLLGNPEAKLSQAGIEAVVAASRFHHEYINLLLRRPELKPSHAYVIFWWAEPDCDALPAQQLRTLVSVLSVRCTAIACDTSTLPK